LEKGDLMGLEGFGEKSSENLVAAIAERKRIDLARLLIGLSIPHVGEEMAILLAEEFGTLQALRKASEEKIAAIHGIGETIAQSVTEWFSDKEKIRMLDELLQHLTITKPKTKKMTSRLSGKTIVLTGTLPTLSRDEAKAKIRAVGARPASSVSANTDYVLLGENAGTKADDAKRLGITTISEEEFLALLKE
jgi:DNA ligase (NAD+)